MKIKIPYEFPNWNQYIAKERTNKYIASSIKRKEAEIVSYYAKEQYKGNYPIKLTITKYFKDKRQDLDNVRIKGVLDGLVKCGVIRNDNLTNIQEIVLKPEFSNTEIGLEIEITELKETV